MQVLAADHDRLEARVLELLAANTREVERRRLAENALAGRWFSIETAPRSGMPLLLANVEMGVWARGFWHPDREDFVIIGGNWTPTHWGEDLLPPTIEGTHHG